MHQAQIPRQDFSIRRFFFLSRWQLLQTVCETRDPTRLQSQLPLLFPGKSNQFCRTTHVEPFSHHTELLNETGIARLELGEMHEATALISPLEERMPLILPVKTREYRGCVEKWLAQVTQ